MFLFFMSTAIGTDPQRHEQTAGGLGQTQGASHTTLGGTREGKRKSFKVDNQVIVPIARQQTNGGTHRSFSWLSVFTLHFFEGANSKRYMYCVEFKMCI